MEKIFELIKMLFVGLTNFANSQECMIALLAATLLTILIGTVWIGINYVLNNILRKD